MSDFLNTLKNWNWNKVSTKKEYTYKLKETVFDRQMKSGETGTAKYPTDFKSYTGSPILQPTDDDVAAHSGIHPLNLAASNNTLMAYLRGSDTKQQTWSKLNNAFSNLISVLGITDTDISAPDGRSKLTEGLGTYFLLKSLEVPEQKLQTYSSDLNHHKVVVPTKHIISSNSMKAEFFDRASGILRKTLIEAGGHSYVNNAAESSSFSEVPFYAQNGVESTYVKGTPTKYNLDIYCVYFDEVYGIKDDADSVTLCDKTFIPLMTFTDVIFSDVSSVFEISDKTNQTYSFSCKLLFKKFSPKEGYTYTSEKK